MFHSKSIISALKFHIRKKRVIQIIDTRTCMMFVIIFPENLFKQNHIQYCAERYENTI